MKFSTADGLLLAMPVVMTLMHWCLLLLLLLLLLLMTRISRHDRGDAEVRRTLSIRIAGIIKIIEEASIWWLTGTIITLIPSATRQPWGNGRGGDGGALGLHFPSEKAPGVLLVLLTLGSSATATTPATSSKRRQDQSVSLPSGEGTRLQQHHLPVPCRFLQLLPKHEASTLFNTKPQNLGHHSLSTPSRILTNIYHVQRFEILVGNIIEFMQICFRF